MSGDHLEMVRRDGGGRRITKGLGTPLGYVYSHCLHCGDGFMVIYICQSLSEKYFPSTLVRLKLTHQMQVPGTREISINVALFHYHFLKPLLSPPKEEAGSGNEGYVGAPRPTRSS